MQTSQQMLDVSPPWWMWVAFHLVVFVLLAIDLGFGHRKVHSPKFGEAISWVGFYVFAAALFAAWLYFEYGTQTAILFATGYLVEYSLSVDNLFVFVLVFSFFAVPHHYRHRVLFWGIIGALIFRGLFIGAGTILISRFDWILYIFGAFLVYTAAKMYFTNDEDEVDPSKNFVLKWFRKHFPITDQFVGAKFAVKIDGKLLLTPLALVLVCIETTDILFAVDSIPAIFSVTSNPFLVYTSNVFAILGLRSLFFVLDRLLPLFRYLKVAIAIILAFIGVKMLIHVWYDISSNASLAFIAVILTGSILLSVVADKYLAKKK